MADSEMMIRYAGGVRTVQEIQSELEQVLRDVETRSELTELAPEADTDQLVELYDVRASGAGDDPGAVEILIVIAPHLGELALSLWDRLILPKLERALGEDVLGDEKDRKGA
jgi:hypothetical protein